MWCRLFSVNSLDNTVFPVAISIVIIQNAPIDPLSDVLGLAELQAACSVRLSAGGDWALRFQPRELKFNVVQHGRCWLLVGDDAPALLEAGDCFVITRTPFVLASDPALPAIDAAAVFADSPNVASYGQGDDVALLGGSVTLDGAGASALLDLLPPSLVIAAGAGPTASTFAWLLDALDHEWRADLPGAQTVCNDLLRLMFVHALRRHVDGADVASLGWLGGLRDPAIAAALRAIHVAPAQHWKLQALADIAGMSRSAFAARFKQRIGQTPVDYATHWRMQLAAARLRTTLDSVSRIASSLGFLSDAAFGATFRRVHGMAPGQYRRAHANAVPIPETT